LLDETAAYSVRKINNLLLLNITEESFPVIFLLKKNVIWETFIIPHGKKHKPAGCIKSSAYKKANGTAGATVANGFHSVMVTVKE